MDALVKRVNDLSVKAGLPKFTSTLSKWKRWVGGEKEYDVTGLRDVVNTNAIYTDAIKKDVDADGQAITDLTKRVQVLEEAPAARPFP